MTIVRYTNKKTGIVSLYESTSHYDPETQQSRPVRKYLGREDPVTHELIPSTGKRGKKPSVPSSKQTDEIYIAELRNKYEEEITSLKAQLQKQNELIKQMEKEKTDTVRMLSDLLRRLS